MTPKDLTPSPSPTGEGSPRTGRWIDVLVQPIVNLESTLEHKVAGFYVWADEGMLKVLAAVEGVWCVGLAAPTLYTAMLDQQYDPDWVKDAIETAVRTDLARRMIEAEMRLLEAERNGTG